jgi:hypothetical protein
MRPAIRKHRWKLALQLPPRAVARARVLGANAGTASTRSSALTTNEGASNFRAQKATVGGSMRAVIRQFLATAARTLELNGPVALIATDDTAHEAASWVRRHFAGKLALDCRVPSRRPRGAELSFHGLPIEQGSLRSLLCLDVVER